VENKFISVLSPINDSPEVDKTAKDPKEPSPLGYSLESYRDRLGRIMERLLGLIERCEL
jgi:hypothetical protein